jgi:hypothetical protein
VGSRSPGQQHSCWRDFSRSRWSLWSAAVRRRASPWVAWVAAQSPPSRLPAGRTVPREPSGATGGWATRLQPNVAQVATAPRQSTHHQYSNHTVTVVSRGPAEWESDGGERTFTRGDTVGGQQEQRRGAPAQLRPSDGDFRGTRRPGPAHLSLPEAADLPHSASQSAVPVRALPACLGTTPNTPPARRAALTWTASSGHACTRRRLPFVDR